ncbi:MAG: alpha/beta hydrolase [Sporichthyaceae bacterium]|nr:alpha/beta hydrolase [Sporichthyaceae bacterium]
MPLLPTADGHLEYLITGAGRPVTVFAHGLAGSIAETRPLGSAVAGTRVFLHFRGHGASSAPESPWTYPALAAELAAVADYTAAGRAVGVSLGAGALTTLLASQPARFERLVFFLPAVLDRPRRDAVLDRLRAMARYVDERDVDALADLLLDEQPAAVRDRPDVRAFVRRQARSLVGTPVSAALRQLPDQVPIPDRAVLAAVHAPALVIAQRGDSAHPVWVAEQLAAALPAATLRVFGEDGALWSARAELRTLIAGFLNRQTR